MTNTKDHRRKGKTAEEQVRDRALKAAHELEAVLRTANVLVRTLLKRGTDKDSVPDGPRRRGHEVLISTLAARAVGLAAAVVRFEDRLGKPAVQAILEKFDRPGQPIKLHGVQESSTVRLVYTMAGAVLEPLLTKFDHPVPRGLRALRDKVVPASSGWLDVVSEEEYATITKEMFLMGCHPPLSPNQYGMLKSGIRSDYRMARKHDERAAGRSGSDARAKRQCPVVISPEGRVTVNGTQYTKRLTPEAIRVLRALAAQWPGGLNKSELVIKSNAEDAVRILARLVKRDDILSAEIVLPGKPHREGYRLKDD